MKYLSYVFVCCSILCTTLSCSTSQKIEGLWFISKVKIGQEEMTPTARWVRFNKDKTQASGNGWLQHSIGNWNYEEKTKGLMLNTTNGLKEEFGGFSVRFDKETMIWTREEEGQLVEVFLKKTKELPRSPANTLFGVWKLVEGEAGSKLDENPYLFFRWDQVFVQREYVDRRVRGIYKTHGHRNELEMVFDAKTFERQRWDYELDGLDKLMLSRKEGDQIIRKTYQRIDYIP